MLTIYEDGVPQHPLIVEDDRWYIEHKYEGDDILAFEIPASNEACVYLAEEVRVTDGTNRYSVKKIDEHGGYVNVECTIDLDDWKERFWKNFRMTNSTLAQVFDAIKPSGWKLVGADGMAKRATIEASEGKGLENVTAEEILLRASETYEVLFNYNAVSRTVLAVDPNVYTPSGDYLTDELNLKSVGFVGSSEDIVTRLYPYGKQDEKGNPVTIASVNGGKEYIDNTQYTERIISAAWSDERYTVPKNLLDAAKKKLDTLSYPVRSYECDARNMGGDMELYKVVTLVDRIRKIRVEHRIITYKEYPNRKDLDVVTLSAVPPKIETSMKSIRSEIKQQQTVQRQVIADAALDAIASVTGQNGGHIKIDLVEGNPEKIRVQHENGDETILDETGVFRDGIPYVYEIRTSGRADIDPDTGSAVVHLPEEFIGKEVSVLIQIEELLPQKETDVLQSIRKDSAFDAVLGDLTLNVDCKMIDLTEMTQVRPSVIAVTYSVTGR